MRIIFERNQERQQILLQIVFYTCKSISRLRLFFRDVYGTVKRIMGIKISRVI
jgi:hypothetical protein